MQLQKEDVYPILEELDIIFEFFKEYLIIDQWLRESTKISYILSFVDNPVELWHFKSEINGGYTVSEVKEQNNEKNKEVMLKFLDDVHGRGNYLWRLTALKRIKPDNVQLICICESPMIENNIGKFLFFNVFARFIDGLRSWFNMLSECDNKESIKEQSQISNKDDYVSKKLADAIAETIRTIEKLYFPIKLSYINELSGEYYEKSECNSTLVFLPMSDGVEINGQALEFDFRKEDIFFRPNEFRRIRKVMQIAQKELYLLLEYDKNQEMYKICGISKPENMNKVFSEKEKMDIPWAKAIIKKHMQWEFCLGKQYIFSYINGNYKISAQITDSYLKEKCVQIFKREDEYRNVIDYVKTSCKQSHGTMIVILSDKDAKSETERFTRGKFGMKNTREFSEESKLDINAFNAIDGSIIMDQKGKIYAIGVILDGPIDTGGNMARGARYNSAVKYRDYLCKCSMPGMILIVSEDGSVEILSSKK